ncbi:hypothetical protein L1887_39012 [Cichorium endivia]|nr:hypothetical protein L1887_39012 [Cichorium endivia]
MSFNKGTSSYQWNKGVGGKARGVEPLRNAEDTSRTRVPVVGNEIPFNELYNQSANYIAATHALKPNHSVYASAFKLVRTMSSLKWIMINMTDEGADNIFGCIGFMFLMHEAYSSLLFLFLCLQNDLGAPKGRGNKYDVERTVLEKRLLYGRVFKSVIILKDKKNGELVVEECDTVLNYWNLVQADKTKLWITNKKLRITMFDFTCSLLTCFTISE